MNNFTRVLLGIVLTGLLGLWAINAKTLPIQADIAARSTKALIDGGQKWAQVNVIGRDVQIIGGAPSDEDRKKAAAIVSEIKGVYRVADETKTVVTQKPFTLTLAKSESAVDVSGFAPNEAIKKSVMTALKTALPDVKFIDSQKIAFGAPSETEWNASIQFAIFHLAKLKTGVAKLSDETLSIEGIAIDGANYTSSMAGLKSVPAGVKLTRASIVPPVVSPYIFDAKINANTLAISGFLPTEQAKNNVVKVAKTLTPSGGAFAETIQFGSGAPQELARTLGAAFTGITSFSEGGFSVIEDKITFFGTLKSGISLEQFRANFKAYIVDYSSVKEAI